MTIAVATEADATTHILLADDNPDMRAYLERLLGVHWSVEAVGNAEAALAAMRRRRPALVLIEMMMSGLDGFGLLRAMRQDPETQDIPVLMLSAGGEDPLRLEGVGGAADDHLVKPFSSRELLTRVAARMERQLRQMR